MAEIRTLTKYEPETNFFSHLSSLLVRLLLCYTCEHTFQGRVDDDIRVITI
jgi:hypothetical protein